MKSQKIFIENISRVGISHRKVGIIAIVTFILGLLIGPYIKVGSFTDKVQIRKIVDYKTKVRSVSHGGGNWPMVITTDYFDTDGRWSRDFSIHNWMNGYYFDQYFNDQVLSLGPGNIEIKEGDSLTLVEYEMTTGNPKIPIIIIRLWEK